MLHTFDMKYYLRLREDHISCSIHENYEGARKDAFRNMLDYLNQCGITMPMPKWRYRENDIKTWKYLDSGRIDRKTGKIIEALNPLFGYRDYDK